MRGQQKLIELRLAGYAPQVVVVNVGTDPNEGWRYWHKGEPPHFAFVEVEDRDSLRRLDMRCVVGLPVFVSGQDVHRVQAVHGIATQAGAASVQAIAYRPTGFEHDAQTLWTHHEAA